MKITSKQAIVLAGQPVRSADADRAANVHSKVCELLRSENILTPDGVMGLLGSCVLQVSKQFNISRQDAETILCAIMRGAEFKPS